MSTSTPSTTRAYHIYDDTPESVRPSVASEYHLYDEVPEVRCMGAAEAISMPFNRLGTAAVSKSLMRVDADADEHEDTDSDELHSQVWNAFSFLNLNVYVSESSIAPTSSESQTETEAPRATHKLWSEENAYRAAFLGLPESQQVNLVAQLSPKLLNFDLASPRVVAAR